MKGLDDHIEGRFDSNNPANMIECPSCEEAMVRPDDDVCWKCGKEIKHE